MQFQIQAEMTYDFAERCEVLLLLEAAHGPDQTVRRERLDLNPAVDVARLDDPSTGERRAVFAAEGRVSLRYDADVSVLDRDATLEGSAALAIRDLPGDVLRYLRPSRYCPSDRFESFVQREFSDLSGGGKVARMMAWIAGHVDYRAGVSDATSTAQDTFVDRAGVCRDFAHLAITLCRAADIPARAVSAYAWKLDPPDMHAVVEVYLGGRWRLIDPTGLAPIEGLVRVATGLDAADIAFMTIFGQAELVSQSFAIREA
ncbi:MAG: transglutaminase family protein [Alphaproteobacteria bacterium]|nr:transglutaminase family protein [Alphaproteobacteria bacterium]MBU1517125.1 transglutaminase family protein [Alphaproteobacteria bacterium]MBU2093744.1 transglutaminase family protein [Alphaproteobacteria bacterium]MBU2153934.1 transglutaminase family protein [Alphaproteobacteria bacterium]MBU2308656.1 transglutaminase family protein [Alphaproteobacteria bacterium]